MKVIRTIIFTLLILGVAAVLIVKNQGAKGDSEAVKALADAQAQGKPAWMFIHSNSCQPCVETAKVFKDLQTEFAGKIAFIDVDFDNPVEKTMIKKYGINMIPTSIFFDSHGEQVEKKVGAMPADDFRRALTKLLES